MVIEDIVVEPVLQDHTDSRRSIVTLHNGDLQFSHIKLTQVLSDSVLGGHYHPHSELIYVYQGNMRALLHDIESGQERTVEVPEGHKVVFPPKIAHNYRVSQGTVLIHATPVPYTTMDEYAIPWKVLLPPDF